MRNGILSMGMLLGIVIPCSQGAEDLPDPLVTGIENPESVAVDGAGRIYVSSIGEFGKDGDGALLVVKDGKATPVATGLDDPKGVVVFKDFLFVTDKDRVWRIDRSGKKSVFVPASAFPSKPQFLNDIAVDVESGVLFVSDSGDLKGNGGAVYSIDPKGVVSTVADQDRWPGLHTPNGLALDGASHLLVGDFGTGQLHRIKLADGSIEKVADGLEGQDGLAWDPYGRLFISSWKNGRLFVIARPGQKPVELLQRFEASADLCVDQTGRLLLVPDMKAGTVTALAISPPGAEVNVTPLAIETEVAFPDLKWTGWKPEADDGSIVPLRPIVLTHAGDGSNRVFVATERGVIHVFPDDQKATKTEVFADLQDRVRYNDKQNEEGFLGMAFHPRYKENGEFFVFYTIKNAPHPHTNVVSRFRVDSDDPNRADPASEEVLLRVEHPFWNHDGGTVAFGPNGYLYVALGDGGSANDPYGNGQNLQTLLGSVLRIDVDHRQPGRAYAIPKDNPFVGRPDALPEIWAHGLRNVWRLSFDRETGDCWAGDVGQNLWEEINLLVSGGNYGWNVREALHPFGVRGVGPNKDLIDPIWEYHHDIGKSITGGFVYRGKRLPELVGAYLYGDYVSGRIWALRYDAKMGRVIANQPIRNRNLPILSFGEDERGEVYLLTFTPSGKGIYRFTRTESKGD